MATAENLPTVIAAARAARQRLHAMRMQVASGRLTRQAALEKIRRRHKDIAKDQKQADRSEGATAPTASPAP